jgi:outer membrane protein insertion porin family
MRRLLFSLLAFGVAATSANAQQESAGPCSAPDSVQVRGNKRVSTTSIRADAGLVARTELNFPVIRRAIRDLFSTGQFEDVQISCIVDSTSSKATMIVTVKERPVLDEVSVVGVKRLSEGSVKDKVELLVGRAIDPTLVAKAVQRIDSMYEKDGYYLARVVPETTLVADGEHAKLVFRIDEGRRLAVSGVQVDGNARLSDKEIVGAMKTRPEGFFWFRKGEFDEDKYAQDLAENLPKLYGSRGYIDFQVLKDTMIVDRERGKALIRLQVSEGPQYKTGNFDVSGNKRFPTSEIRRFYEAADQAPSLVDRVKGVVKRQKRAPKGVFDRTRWEDATNKVRTAYSNEGYIYAAINPVVDREALPNGGADSAHVVNLRWEIDERSPAIINRIEIAGNDYTSESCIRDQLVILPGDVFNQDRLIRSYQNIGNLGFFETPLPSPDTRPANDQGDVDIVFAVKEKRTGNVNFGASMGQGTGVGGFIGLDQPNLFGQCKRGSLQWQFGSYINDFNLSYTDPAIRRSRTSATISAYRSQNRYTIYELGRATRTGASLQVGFPVRNSPFTRLFVSYGGEAVKYGNDGLLGQTVGTCENCFRSSLGLTMTHDTRIDMPFATAGNMRTVTASFNGGPLGGTANFQRYTGEMRAYAPLGQIGGTRIGSSPIKFTLGLTTRAGSVFGNTGPFFYSQQFTIGGVQYGEMLRGYDEFSIGPSGYLSSTSRSQASTASFGSAFFTTTAEAGVRFSQMLYVNTFFDAGNIWSRPRDFDPTRLFRGTGVGVSLVTPLGPLGLDWAYGLDRVNTAGRREPKWMLHFRLGQLF